MSVSAAFPGRLVSVYHSAVFMCRLRQYKVPSNVMVSTHWPAWWEAGGAQVVWERDWWHRLGSNQRHDGYEPSALPLSYGAGADGMIAESCVCGKRAAVGTDPRQAT